LRYPICTFDARSGVLCPNCQAKLKEGKISQADVDVSVKLSKVSESNPQLQKFSLQRAVRLNNRHYILVFADNQVSQLEAMPQVLEVWRNQLGARIWLVESGFSDRRLLESLIQPARIATVNTIWLPSGEKLLKPVFERNRKGHRVEYADEDIPREKAMAIREAVRTLRGVDVLIGPTLPEDNLESLGTEKKGEEGEKEEREERVSEPRPESRIAMPA
jgi:Zn-finger nucleic acid-binding protein